MKTTKFFALLLSFMAVMLSVGCQPEPVDKPDVPDEKPCFEFEILETGKTSVSFRVTPLAEEMPYVIMIVDKASFDAFESVEAYIADDIAWFDQIALGMGISLEDYLASILTTGVKEDSASGLAPDTEYYLYAYHLTASGEVVSDLEYKAFKTAALDKSDATFEVSVSGIGYHEATVSVVSSSATMTYFINVLSEEQLAAFGEGAEAYVNHLVALRDYYLGMGATTEQMIANLCFAGEKSLTVNDLTPGVKHYAYAIGVDGDFLPNTDAFVVEFETTAANSSDLSFEVEITGVDYDHVEGFVTPSNNDERYVCSIQTAESLTWYASDEEFMQVLLDDLEWWYGGVETALHTGVTDLSAYGGLYPETEYVVVCFGYDETPTTELFTFPFTTTEASGNPEDLVVEFDIDYERLSHNTVYVTATPSEGVYYFLSYISTFDLECYVEEYGTEDAALVAFANEEIDYGAEFFWCSRAEYLADMGANLGTYTMMFNQLSPNTEYVIYAVAVDINSGEVASSKVSVSEAFTTLDKVMSSAAVEFEFGNYYDGTTLAELDPERFLSCMGYVVMPYAVKPNADAMNWYTGFFSGDYTEWGCSDEDIYAELITYGYEWESELVSLNRESGVAVLQYDAAFTFLGIAEDYEGNFGAGTLEVVTLSRDGVSPAQEFIDSLDQQSVLAKAQASAPHKAKLPVMRK